MEKEKNTGTNKTLKMIVVISCILITIFVMVNKFYQVVNTVASQKAEQIATEYLKKVNYTGNAIDLDNQVQSLSGKEIATVEIDDNDTSTSQIAEKVMPSLVSVTNLQTTEVYDLTKYYYEGKEETIEKEIQSAGSGVIIGDNGDEIWIVTNHHVVSSAKTIMVTFADETSVSAYLKGYDKNYDIAVISVKFSDISNETKGKISVIKTGDSTSVKPGEDIICIGNALNFGQTVTTGVISAKDRTIKLDTGIQITALQFDAAINHGSSGGALLNYKGELIGITTAKNTSEDAENVSFAIPISNVENTLKSLCAKIGRKTVSDDNRTYLGIEVLDTPSGALVTTITNHTPAYKSNLCVGDYIIELNGQTITSVQDIKSELLYHKPGEIIEVKVKRPDNKDYVIYKFTVKLEKNQENKN